MENPNRCQSSGAASEIIDWNKRTDNDRNSDQHVSAQSKDNRGQLSQDSSKLMSVSFEMETCVNKIKEKIINETNMRNKVLLMEVMLDKTNKNKLMAHPKQPPSPSTLAHQNVLGCNDADLFEITDESSSKNPNTATMYEQMEKNFYNKKPIQENSSNSKDNRYKDLNQLKLNYQLKKFRYTGMNLIKTITTRFKSSMNFSKDNIYAVEEPPVDLGRLNQQSNLIERKNDSAPNNSEANSSSNNINTLTGHYNTEHIVPLEELVKEIHSTISSNDPSSIANSIISHSQDDCKVHNLSTLITKKGPQSIDCKFGTSKDTIDSVVYPTKPH